MKIYRYPLHAVFSLYFFATAFSVICGGAAVFVIYGLINHPSMFSGSLGGWLLMIAGWLFSALILPVILLYAFRPVAMDTDGIKTFMGTRVWRFIPWAEVTKVERIKMIDQYNGQKRTQFWFYSNDKKIMFDNRLTGLTDLVDRVNEQLQAHAIPVFDIQRSNKIRHQVPVLVIYDALTGKADEASRSPITRI